MVYLHIHAAYNYFTEHIHHQNLHQFTLKFLPKSSIKVDKCAIIIWP